MAYCAYDRHGGLTIKYSNLKTTEYVGAGTYWPDYGPTTRESSGGGRNRPTDHIYEKVVKPRASGQPADEALPKQTQFRHPSLAREAILREVDHTPEAKAKARETTEKQIVLRRLELRQQKVDSWLEDAPNRPPIRRVRTSATASADTVGSLATVSNASFSSAQASVVSRDVYARHGYLVGKSKGAVADGYGGLRQRKPHALSFQAMLFGKEVVNPASSRRSLTTRKPTKQWRVYPENHFVYDPKVSLPVLRGERRVPRMWPESELVPRMWSEPDVFSSSRNVPSGDLEANRHKTPSARNVSAGVAGTTLPRKLAYGSQSDPHLDLHKPWNGPGEGTALLDESAT